MAAAYVASARLDRGRPHLATRALTADRPVAVERLLAGEAWLLDTSPPGQRDLELRWEAFRERWSQLVFFLLDPESWR